MLNYKLYFINGGFLHGNEARMLLSEKKMAAKEPFVLDFV